YENTSLCAIGTGRIDVARGLLNTSVVSRVMTVTISHVKEGGSGQTASVHPFARPLQRDLPSHSPLERREPELRTRTSGIRNSNNMARLVEIPPTTVHKYKSSSDSSFPKPPAALCVIFVI
ncbi:hypothetical protein AVEN_93298-1, partial [Araneus ventricosus]